MVAGSMESMVRRGSWPYFPLAPSWCVAMGMIQLVEKSLSAPRGPLCWVSARKAVPWSMRVQPRYWLMIMGTGVEAGSMLVPEEVWASSASIRVVGGLDMSMLMSISLGLGFSIPGMSGIGLCCAWRSTG